MEIIWSPNAVQDLADLRIYVARQNPQAAVRLVRRIVDVVETLLATQPAMAKPGRVGGTRELVVAGTPYIIPYRIIGDRIEIIRVYHSARRWPDLF